MYECAADGSFHASKEKHVFATHSLPATCSLSIMFGLPYVKLIQHFLKKGGTQAIKLQLLDCLQVVYN